ncbi:MAG: AAA family ATPase, partial [Propionibacteriaceae bacterium]|nr:AAA family ATPase [Propionibacteriaceae bacterium]
MYLKRLVLRGFKSFASTTTLALEPGITCVVGPNGSGKSNVVDALSWVMGEQGPKSLRGASMEDVIFAGTAQRSQLGRAEVQLTIDNSDQALPIDYTEVTISRTKFRNGASEYSINGTPCRLLDVRELLSDSGIGREMHVIVGQGQLDAILQATPETRRGLIEEAAGVLKHRERKEKALRKLDATEANLHRLTDLVAEIRRQLKPLGRQAEVARRASLVQAELRDAKARLLADDLVQATAALATDLASEADAQAEREATERRLNQARQAEETAQATVAEAVVSLNQAQDTWYRLSGLAEQVRSTLTLAGERIRHAAAQTPTDQVTGRDPETLEAQAAETTKAELALRADVVSGGQALAQASASRQSAETAHAAAETEFAAALRAEADRREGLARLAGQVASARSRVESADEQIARQSQAIELAQRRQGDSQAEGAELARQVEALAQAAAQAEQALGLGLSQVEETSQAVAQAQAAARQWAERRSGWAARIEALRLAE